MFLKIIKPFPLQINTDPSHVFNCEIKKSEIFISHNSFSLCPKFDLSYFHDNKVTDVGIYMCKLNFNSLFFALRIFNIFCLVYGFHT